MYVGVIKCVRNCDRQTATRKTKFFDDVHIFVDYAVSENGDEAVYEAWAQLADANFRAVVYDSVVPYKDDESAISDIICELNMSEQFHNTVQHFIEHFDR